MPRYFREMTPGVAGSTRLQTRADADIVIEDDGTVSKDRYGLLPDQEWWINHLESEYGLRYLADRREVFHD